MYQTNEERAYKPIDFHNIVLDFTDCKYPADIHRVLKESFGFPEYYGANLDALHDCLCEIAVPVEVQMIRWEYLGEQGERYRQVLMDSAQENPNLIILSN